MSEKEPIELSESLLEMDRSQIKEFVAGIRAIWAKQDAKVQKSPDKPRG